MRITKLTIRSLRPAYTLVEVVLSVALLSVMSTTTIGLIRYSSEDFLFGSRRTHLLQEGRAALSKMVTTLRQADTIVSVSGPTDTAGSITFTDPNGVEYQFDLDSSSDELDYGPTGTLYGLTDSVASLTLTCYDVNGTTLTAPVTIADIVSIGIEATLTDATDTSISFDLSTRVYWTMNSVGTSSGSISFVQFTEAKQTSNAQSVTIDTPSGVSVGDLLIAAVVTDAQETLSPPGGEGWTEIDQGWATLDQATLGVWWKLAEAGESASHTFTWGSNEQSYAWMMHFTGHDSSDPIHASATGTGTSSSPTSPAVTTTVANCLILRMIGLEDYEAVEIDDPGLSGHTTVTMDVSTSTSNSCAGGAGYTEQTATGSSGTSQFSLDESDQYRCVTVAIAPD